MKYTAGYVSGDRNFIIQNVSRKTKETWERDPAICLLKNILQRGIPTKPSEYLEKRLALKNSNLEPVYFCSNEIPSWTQTIKGDDETGHIPAKDFFYDILPGFLEDYAFVLPLIVPEYEIIDITRDETQNHRDFLHMQVDFYLPQARLVIEIDGTHHVTAAQIEKDNKRDAYLEDFGVETVRISTKELNNWLRNYIVPDGMEKIINRLALCEDILEPYRYGAAQFEITKEVKTVAVMRWQLAVLSMLENDVISLEDSVWNFEIIDHEETKMMHIGNRDLFLWMEHLYKLLKKPFHKPSVKYTYVDEFTQKDSIKIDFSLRKRWTDENFKNEHVIYVRTAYDQVIDHFKITVADPINYDIIQDGEDSDIPALCFILRNLFGHDNFQDGQLPIIVNALTGRDTVGLLPTGAGKSLCFQMAVLLQPAISFVVVPIKALMHDQIDNMYSYGMNRVGCISSDQTAAEKEIVQRDFSNGKYLFIYISPERFQQDEFRSYLSSVNRQFMIALGVIDEVHCLSEWGHDFRTSYLHLCPTIRKYCPTARLLGLSATASVNVLNDILISFETEKENVKTLIDYSRDELHFNLQILDNPSIKNKNNMTLGILRTLMNRGGLRKENEKYVHAGLVFTLNVNGKKGCYEVANHIASLVKEDIPFYSGSVPKKQQFSEKEYDKYKLKIQGEYKSDKHPMIVATKAFGMGIDKPNIRYTIHFSLPGSLESLYQEAGRAGRDKKKATNFIIYSQDDIDKADLDKLFQLNTSIEEITDILRDTPMYKQGDILGNFFLWTQNNKGVAQDTQSALAVYVKCAKAGEKALVPCSRLKLKFEVVEKAIYRLSILGIVDDWTIAAYGDYGSFLVEFTNFNMETIHGSFLRHIQKYEPDFSFETGDENFRSLMQIYQGNRYFGAEKYFRMLIQWTYDHIFYNRRMSLKNLVDYSITYQNDPAGFKRTIESYFKFTEHVFVLDHIAQNPDDYREWFNIFYVEDTDELISESALMELRVALNRFLESYRFNTGLNFLSGMTELMLNEFTEINGRERLVAAFNQITSFGLEEQRDILKKVLEISAKGLYKKRRENISEIVCTYYPDEHILIYEHLKDNHSLHLSLKKINQKLTEIGADLDGKLK